MKVLFNGVVGKEIAVEVSRGVVGCLAESRSRADIIATQEIARRGRS